MSVAVRDVAEGTAIVLVPESPAVFHLPAGGRHPRTGRPVTLVEHLDGGGAPLHWAALCGARGHVWVYRSTIFRVRNTCAECVELAGADASELAPPPLPLDDHCFYCFDQGGDDDGSPRCPACRRIAA